MIEYGLFRKSGNGYDVPLEKWTFESREKAQAALEKFTDGPEWLEVRSRAVTTWLREDEEL